MKNPPAKKIVISVDEKVAIVTVSVILILLLMIFAVKMTMP